MQIRRSRVGKTKNRRTEKTNKRWPKTRPKLETLRRTQHDLEILWTRTRRIQKLLGTETIRILILWWSTLKGNERETCERT